MMTQSSKDEAAKERIIKHMNADHKDSLVRYLEHFCHLSSFSARNAKLTNITLDSFSISSGHSKSHLVPIQPAMGSWSEARTKFADLDAQAVQGLGRSNVTIKSYVRPRGFMAVVFVAVIINITCFSRRSNFRPGSILYDVLLNHVEGFACFCYTIQPYLLYTTLAIHVTEIAYFHPTRLRKHSVPTFSRLWWAWMCDTFVVGIFAFMRFDKTVKEEEAMKANAKH